MNSIDWQQSIALLCVAAAAGILARQAGSWFKGNTCAGCKQCSQAKTPTVMPLNTLTLTPSLQARQSKQQA